MVTKRIYLGDRDQTLLLCGEHDSNLRALEKKWGVQIFARSSTLAIRGKTHGVDQVVASLEELLEKENSEREDFKNLENNIDFGEKKVEHELKHKNPQHKIPVNMGEPIFLSAGGKKVYELSSNQKKYVESIESSDLVMAVGPAGTGKTFLAVVCALKALQSGRVRKIVLTRPVVETGEKLGFLPGDLYEKINPYLKPLYDAFHFLLGPERFRIFREDETVEIVPLAYMRGRTLENSFVILDEAQNTTPEQMKMFLTRLGTHSKMVITGDVTQIDLDFKARSGFVHSLKILKKIPEIHFINFCDEDVVRHPLIKKILKAYELQEPETKSE